ncbi:hypothetical protein G4Y79_23710 [Phototrophicus methaneseepsis]|uniref:Uncharacterized protein n=1 Tax=Phototrophicus methaneseepsis TaxID=2710758 RepID=A0A7S8E952_9CHLR|nr:hypothetical protein [Phototrophicus methaneseepsis]QPC82657.1 hypothetical protein G4Y79_23710 [Phototrophicus methaneseepsis]
MMDKQKNEKTKNEKRKGQPIRPLAMGLFILGTLLILVISVVGVVLREPEPIPNVVNAEAVQEAIQEESGASAPPNCNFMWHNQADEDLSAALTAALDDAGIDYQAAIVEAYGEQEICQSEDGSYYDGNFNIMDWSPKVTVTAPESDAARGQQILDMLPIVEAALGENRIGYVNVVFMVDGEESLWRVSHTDLEAAIAEGTSPEAIYALSQ